MKDKATYTHDIPRDLAKLVERLRKCDGVSSDCAVIVWEQAQLLVKEIDRLREAKPPPAAQQSPFPENLTAKEVAAMARVTPETLHAWVAAGKFPQPIRLGLKKVWSRTVVDAVLRQAHGGDK